MTAALQAKELYMEISQRWALIQGCVQQKHWNPFKYHLSAMKSLSEDFLWVCFSEEACNNVSKILVEAGKVCNTLMFNSLAKDCFSSAIEVLKNVDVSNEAASIMGESMECLIQSHLHNRDLEVAKSLLEEWNKELRCPLVFHPLVIEAQGKANLEVGLTQVKNSLCNSAIETLELASEYLTQSPEFEGSEMEANLLSALGYCLHHSSEPRALHVLQKARQAWKALHWPLHEVKTIVYALKNYMECLLKEKNLSEEHAVHEELLLMHRVLIQLQNDMLIADVFTCLGMVAFHNECEQKAVTYFEQACALHKQQFGGQNNDEVIKLLRFIGVASYNCLDFNRAAEAYLECLQLLETQYPLEANKLGYVAECCASLGFTYSRLRDFDNMLLYYERALELEQRLSLEDLELIITNIGSLYHVKAVKLENQGNPELSLKYYEQAKEAFNKALRYSWKSFPFINFGYYLLCQGGFSQAASVLQQGYLNGIIDKDTVEFDHTEDPILIDDLKFELQGQEYIRMPSTVIALYLKTLAQVNMGDVIGAESTAEHLDQEVVFCNYNLYYTAGYGQERMEALCKSLVGYAYRATDNQSKATLAFESALAMLPQYDAVKRNLERQRLMLQS